MLRLKHSPDNDWTRYGALSLSGASGGGQDLQRYLVLDGVYGRPCYANVFCLIPCYAIPSGHV